jgi:hypothetical protein
VVKEPCGALVDLFLEPVQGVDRVVDAGPDEPFGAVAPQPEFDAFAVDQDEAAVGRQGAMGDDQLQGDGLAAAGFAADEHVPLGQGDLDPAAQLISAQMDGLPDGQRRDRDAVSRHRCSPP